MTARRWLLGLELCACTPRGVEDAQPDEQSAEPVRFKPAVETTIEPKPERVHAPVAGITQVAAGSTIRAPCETVACTAGA